jgi:hypothetical protein
MEERAHLLPNRNAQEINGLGWRRGLRFGRSSPPVVVLGQQLQILDLTGNFTLEPRIG